jgi:hypothetical protein
MVLQQHKIHEMHMSGNVKKDINTRQKSKTNTKISELFQSSDFLWILFSCSDNHFNLSLRSARCFKMSSSSNKEYFPSANAFLNTELSIVLVKQSASIAWLLTHLNLQFSAKRSRMRRHSNVVLNSSQEGVEVFVERSYTDLQSVAMVANGECCKISDGFVQSVLGFPNQAHITLSQLTLSSVLLNADASALKVLLTTLGIFLLDQAMGQITES